MSEYNEPTYAAVITLSLPNGEGVAAHITLTPADRIEQQGQVKPLQDCTLADLRVFADALESEVWQAYHQIRLLDLAEGEEVQVEVTVEDRKGQTVSLPQWRQQAVLLAPAGAALATSQPPEEEVAAVDLQAEGDAPEESITREADGQTGQPEVADSEDTPTVATEPIRGEIEEIGEHEPLVTVSQSEPVYAEREAIDDPHAFPTPAIAPSQARVRIAGRRLPLSHPTQAAVDILIDEPALRATQAHALSSPKREVAGVLLGPPPEKQPDGRYVVHVIDSIIAKYTVMQGASVTYTPESWRYMNDKLAERYPDETAVMVGWYHTHPGFGIFLSGMDQFIHQNFFTQIWHIALVLDPLANKSGFFCWDRLQSNVNRHDFGWPAWAGGSW